MLFMFSCTLEYYNRYYNQLLELKSEQGEKNDAGLFFAKSDLECRASPVWGVLFSGVPLESDAANANQRASTSSWILLTSRAALLSVQ